MDINELRKKLNGTGIVLKVLRRNGCKKISITIDGVRLNSNDVSLMFKSTTRNKIAILERIIGNEQVTHEGVAVQGFGSLRKNKHIKSLSRKRSNHGCTEAEHN